MSKTILTHSGSFQADDIFAVAILQLVLGDDTQVVRTREPEQIEKADYVVDVGMIYDPSKNRFDHHQPGGAGERPNGIPYASCGLVWKEYGENLAGDKEAAEIIDSILMASLDAHDNGVATADYRFKNIRFYSLVDYFYSFVPTLNESDEELYKIFMYLVGLAKELLIREIAKAKDLIVGEAKVKKNYDETSDKRVIVLPEELPWGRVFRDRPEVLFVINPRNDGRWGLRAVQEEGFVSRKKLPSIWGGKTREELQEITGVDDAHFCHRALFMAVADSKEGALKLAEIALNA